MPQYKVHQFIVYGGSYRTLTRNIMDRCVGAFGSSAAPERASLLFERVSILNTLSDISPNSASNAESATSFSDLLSSDSSPAIQLNSRGSNDKFSGSSPTSRKMSVSTSGLVIADLGRLEHKSRQCLCYGC